MTMMMRMKAEELLLLKRRLLTVKIGRGLRIPRARNAHRCGHALLLRRWSKMIDVVVVEMKQTLVTLKIDCC